MPVVTCAPVASSAKTPERMRTASGSWRCVVKRDWPGRRLSSQGWMSASVERDARRAAVDHAADRRPVALAEGRDAEEMAEGVERHVKLFGFGAPRCGSPRAPGGQIVAPAHARG